MIKATVFVLHAMFPTEYGGETLIAAYDSSGDCWEIADSLNATSETTEFWCEKVPD